MPDNLVAVYDPAIESVINVGLFVLASIYLILGLLQFENYTLVGKIIVICGFIPLICLIPYEYEYIYWIDEISADRIYEEHRGWTNQENIFFIFSCLITNLAHIFKKPGKEVK